MLWYEFPDLQISGAELRSHLWGYDAQTKQAFIGDDIVSVDNMPPDIMDLATHKLGDRRSFLTSSLVKGVTHIRGGGACRVIVDGQMFLVNLPPPLVEKLRSLLPFVKQPPKDVLAVSIRFKKKLIHYHTVSGAEEQQKYDTEPSLADMGATFTFTLGEVKYVIRNDFLQSLTSIILDHTDYNLHLHGKDARCTLFCYNSTFVAERLTAMLLLEKGILTEKEDGAVSHPIAMLTVDGETTCYYEGALPRKVSGEPTPLDSFQEVKDQRYQLRLRPKLVTELSFQNKGITLGLAGHKLVLVWDDAAQVCSFLAQLMPLLAAASQVE
jgi:hypothetical protein